MTDSDYPRTMQRYEACEHDPHIDRCEDCNLAFRLRLAESMARFQGQTLQTFANWIVQRDPTLFAVYGTPEALVHAFLQIEDNTPVNPVVPSPQHPSMRGLRLIQGEE